jgi:ATP-dependent Lon protease
VTSAMSRRTPPSADARALAACADELIGKAKTDAQARESEAAPPSCLAPVGASDPFVFRLADPLELADALKASGGATDDGGRAAQQLLARLSELPELRRLSPAPSLEALGELKIRFPNFTLVVDHLLRHAALSHLVPQSPLHFAPIVLDGAPGIGKTAFSLAVARTFGVPLIQLQMSHATAGFTLGGLDPQYAGGGPGFLTRKVALGPVPDAVVLLDELDKAPKDSTHDPLGPLFSLFEPETARRFADDGLKLPLNFSALRWICTTNDSSQLHPALLSRCEIFSISAPSPAQMAVIARSVYAAILRNAPWGSHFEVGLPEALATELARSTPRDLVRNLRSALGNAVLDRRRYLVLADLPRRPRHAAMGFCG